MKNCAPRAFNWAIAAMRLAALSWLSERMPRIWKSVDGDGIHQPIPRRLDSSFDGRRKISCAMHDRKYGDRFSFNAINNAIIVNQAFANSRNSQLWHHSPKRGG